MLSVEKIDTRSKAQVHRFIHLPLRLYANHPQWAPPILSDIALMLNWQKHPFYEHSDADFFIATRDGRDVGRVAALENRRFNEYHTTKQAQFYLFDCEDDPEAAAALFEQVFEWARARGLNRVVGPKGFGPLDGYGLLVEGFEHRQMMTMMNYPQFQGHGGNALLYSEMEKTIREFKFEHADLTQVAESAMQMRRDLENVGGKAYKNHRVYRRDVRSHKA